MEQRTPEWYAARLGKVTASRVADVVAKTKTGWGASRANYMAELIAERLTQKPADSFLSAAMQWGTDHECDAKRIYQERLLIAVEDCGFVAHPAIEMAGASPDGLVGTDGLVETKCPNTATHLDQLISKTIPEKYLTQMQWQMACTGRQWCDYVSYDPRLPERHLMFIKRVHRIDIVIQNLEEAVVKFLDELDAKLLALEAA